MITNTSDLYNYENPDCCDMLLDKRNTTPINMILVGNKSDLLDNTSVTIDEAKQYAQQKQIPFVQTNAHSNQSLELLHEIAARYTALINVKKEL